MKVPFADSVQRYRAGRFGMTLFLVSLGVIFIATTLGLVVVRIELVRDGLWPTDLPPLPWGMVLSTLVIAASSVMMQRAAGAAARGTAGPEDARAAVRAGLRATIALGTIFLVVQAVCWLSWLAVVRERWADSQGWRLALTAFYVLTGLHGLHVLGGLAALVTTLVRDIRGGYDAFTRRDRVHYCAMYWHFLGAVWLALYAVLLVWG